nr:unnamed protein product [Callosobruchus analis]CAI5818749.1 unnamed protein product [Callosobruchus analis]
MKLTTHTSNITSIENQESSIDLLAEAQDRVSSVDIGSVVSVSDINILPMIFLDQQGISNLPIKSSLELSTDKERNEPAAEDVHLEQHTDLLSKASASRNESEEKSTTHKHSEQASALLSSQNTLQSIKEGQKPVTEDILQEHHSDSPLEESSLCEVEENRTNKDDMSALPNMQQIAQVTPDKLSSQGSSNEVKETSETSSTTPFSRHLSFPTPVDQVERSRMKEKLPSAISCKEWKKYYEKKKEEKQKKLENVRKRKELRELNQSTAVQFRKRKKLSPKKKTDSQSKENTYVDEGKERINCFLCEDELYSDAEEDSEKNIGCDYCTRWYHLRCTEYAEFSYEDVANRDYRCEMCKD